MGSQNLLDNALATRDEIGEWALCVGSYPEKTEDEIAWEMPYRGKHMAISTVGELRGKGYDVVPDHDPEGGIVHALLKLPVSPEEELSEDEWEETWGKLRDCFEPPKRNPTYGQR